MNRRIRSSCLVVLVSALCSLAPAQGLAGRVESSRFTGPVTGTSVPFSIYLPPGYDGGTDRYQVVYHLHGLGGRHDGGHTASVPSSLEAAVTAGVIAPMIVVFPDGMRDSMWSDSYDLAKPVETQVIHELIPYVDDHYRTRTGWEHRVVQGFSMGGFGAAKLAAKFPHVFAAGVVYDGAMHDWASLSATRPAIRDGIFGGDAGLFETHSPWRWSTLLADRLRFAPTRVVVGALQDFNRAWRDHLTALRLPVDYVETGLGHNLAALLAAQGQASWAFIADAFPLEGHWSFDEGGGAVVRDSSGNGFDGSFVGGGGFVGGVRGGAIELDGNAQYVEITDSNGHPDVIGDLAVGSFSVWFAFDGVTVRDEIFPVLYLGDGVGGAGNSSLILEIGHFNAGNARAYFTVLWDDRQIRLCFDSRFSLAQRTWHNLTVVVGPDFNTGYLDGEEMVLNAVQPPSRHYNFGDATVRQFFADVVDKRVFWLGRGFLSSRLQDQYLPGRIDELRIYNRPLHATEVAELFAAVELDLHYYGNGTAGTGARLPEIFGAGGAPVIGATSFGLGVRDALPNAPSVLLLGAVRGGAPVPGLGIDLNVALPAIVHGFQVGAGGSFLLGIRVPADPALAGVELFSQAVVLDAAAVDGLAATRGLGLVIGG